MQLKTLYPCTFILNCNSVLNPERESLTCTCAVFYTSSCRVEAIGKG